ncbi:hypothetical protein [Halorussus halophilus]|uniref:hypothetical protein n=1 Tax=Halorussus halophilus TaxID=2650975 RepID=UPI001300FA90|nr:hypothetical protein [Halorussus halophilus]
MPEGELQENESLLALFDNLDLEDSAERRVGVYVLEEYYGKTMADVGRKYLGLGEEIRDMNLKTQWGKLRVRIESLDQYSLPEGYSSLIPQLKAFRDNVAHDYDEIPPESNLKNLRTRAPEWKGWLIEQTQEYHEVERELDARQTMVQITKNTLEGVLEQTEWLSGPFESHREKTENRAQTLLDELEEIEEESNEITVNLVHLFADAQELDQEFDAEEIEEALIEWNQQLRVDQHLEDQRMQERE